MSPIKYFLKRSDVPHSTMNEPNTNNDVTPDGRDIGLGLSSGAWEGLSGASNVFLSYESAKWTL